MGIWVMKTTLEISDSLFREVKAKAAMEGCKLKDFVSEGLVLRLHQSAPAKKSFVKFPLIPSKGKRKLRIPDDIASRDSITEDVTRYEASLR
jgi:hypothetical protein